MAGLVLIALIVILLFYIVLSKNSKKAFFISVAIVGAYMLYVRYTCGPDLRDVRVMKPMAETIRDYIIKHGVPESLQDIPNLPYKLEECERKDESTKSIVSKDEKCVIKISNRTIKIYFSYGEYTIDNSLYKKLRIYMKNYSSKTGVNIYYENKNNHFILKEMNFYSGKTSGICNPMRQ